MRQRAGAEWRGGAIERTNVRKWYIGHQPARKSLKFPSRSPVRFATLPPPMTKRLLLCLLAGSVITTTGCTLFSRKARQQKESSAIATETEKEFRQRWVAKRVTELAAQGITGAAAEQQADQEFQQKYDFARRR